MRLLDIHAHILPAVDDGAKDLEISLELLKMMKSQGITDVVATPHFYASEDNLEEFKGRINKAYKKVIDAARGLELPKIYIGAEVLYFRGIDKSNDIRSLCISDSDYLLLELLPNYGIDDEIIKSIVGLNYNLGIIPIIAHIERYSKDRGFKKLLQLIENEIAYAQVNTISVLQPPFNKTVQKLMKNGYISFIASDAHSIVNRPPLMDLALSEIEKNFGKEQKDMYINNSLNLLSIITNGASDEE